MASPLISNVLSGANLNAPISDLTESEGAEAESLFVQLTSQLSLVEILALMQGNFGAIQGLNMKLKNVLLK